MLFQGSRLPSLSSENDVKQSSSERLKEGKGIFMV